MNVCSGIMQQDNSEQVILDPKLIAKDYLRDTLNFTHLHFAYQNFKKNASSAFDITVCPRSLGPIYISSYLLFKMGYAFFDIQQCLSKKS